MFGRNKEKLRGYERRAEAEAAVLKYAELLLTDTEGHERVAVAEHLLPKDAESNKSVARAEFYKENDGYYITEYRDHSESPSFTSYMRPVEQVYTRDAIPEGAKWATGMIRHHWSRFSIDDIDDIAPVAGVLEAFFGKLPK